MAQQQQQQQKHNPYSPQAHSEIKEKKKAHVYTMRANLDKGKFKVYVYDQMTGDEFEETFIQSNFNNIKLFDVAKKTIDSINTTMSGGPPCVTVQQWNGIAYLTVVGGQIPSLALKKK